MSESDVPLTFVRDSSPSSDDGGGLFFGFGPIRTTRGRLDERSSRVASTACRDTYIQHRSSEINSTTVLPCATWRTLILWVCIPAILLS